MQENEKIRHSSHLQAVIDHAPFIIWSVDAGGIITMSEGRGLKEVGLAPGQLVGNSVFDVYKDNPEAIEHVKRALQGETLVEEVEIAGRVYEAHYSPLTDRAGSITGMMGISTDITRRWEAEQQQVYLLKLSDALRHESEPQQIKIKAMQVLGEHLKVNRCYYAEVSEDGENCLIDNSFHSGTSSLDGNYRLADFGKARVAMLRAGEVIIAEDVAKDTLVSEAEREMNLVLQIQSYINIPLVKNNKLICLLGVNKSAPRNWTHLELVLVKETAERTWAAVERARAEIMIQESEKQFKDIISAIPQLVWVCNSEGEAVYFNESWYQFTRAKEEETLGHKWVNLLHPADVDETLTKWNHAQQTATSFISEYRLRTADGKFRWVLSHGIPVLDNKGKIEKWFGTCTDIHDRKNFAQSLEENVAERTIKLTESNRLLERSNEELKQFAYVASHDLQEPLRKIQTFSSMARDEINDTHNLKSYLLKIESSASRMSELIKDVLQFSHASIDAGNFEQINLNALLEQVKIDFELLIQQKQARIEIDRLPSIKANKLQIMQLFSNLISNALKFSNQNPLITVRYKEVENQLIPVIVAGVTMKSYHYLCFSDNGIGFSHEHAEQIFKLFTRLHNKNDYPGTGIGLALCKKIVDNHQGVIHATSQKGLGSSFHIYLPVSV